MRVAGVGLHQELHQDLQLGGEAAGPDRRTDLFGRGRRQAEQMQRQQTRGSRPGGPASILQIQFGHVKGILGVHAGLQTTRPRPSPWLEEEPILPWDMGESTETGATLLVSPRTEPTCSGSDTGKYRLGQKVEGRFRGKGRWYKGRIVGVNAGGTYDVRYDDGDEDLGLDASAIRSEEARDSGRGGSSIDRRDEERRGGIEAGRVTAYRLGDRAEARAPGTNRWQRVTVVGENPNGTLDVRFRDGTEERRLDPSMVRPLDEDDGKRRGNGRDSVDSMEFAEGDRVEARFGGRSRWYKATIERKNGDGTYCLIYADGDEERAVDKSLMRRIGNGGELPRSGSRSPGRRVVSGVESETGSATGKTFRVGDDVEARYKRGRKWYPGVVRRVNRDGTMDIAYKDGDSERDVDPSLVRSKGGVSVDSLASSSADTGFSRGDKVEARFGGRSRWFKATVERENRDGTYHLLYVDGDEERAVEKHLIRRIEGVGSSTADGRAASRSRSPADRRARGDVAGREGFAEGERVEARFGGRSRWSRATVERKNRNGTYRLVYADGNEEREVESRLIRALGSGGDNDGSGSSLRRPSSAVADRRGASNLDSGSDVGNARRTAIRANDRIEARFKGGHNWYAGIVVAVNRDGSFDVKYDDGDREYDVDARLVRSLRTGSVRGASAARERGRGGGGRAEDAADGHARGRHAGASTVSLDSIPADRDFAVGDKVEARFGGRSRWFKATIERENRDGTYHLLYVDGDEERAVEKHLIRRVGASTSPTTGNRSPGRRVVSGVDSETDSAAGKAFRVGDEVEAMYKRGRMWYPGVVRRVNRDGTMDITYKDGDSERDVDPTLVRSKGGVSVDSLASSSADTGFSRGDKVEARFGGRSRWFKATIERENRDGTYHLLYVDGDEERAVEKHLIRRVGASTSPTTGNRSPGRRVVSGVDSETDSAAGKAFRVGDEVEAMYKRGRMWYPGVVRRVNRDGTMDITYKDGDSERDVDPSLVRSKGGVSVDSLETSGNTGDTARGGGGRSSSNDFAVGDKVEARFGGRSRWFRAAVDGKNRDGTYCLLYDDGDLERSVDKKLIRSLARPSGDTKRDEKYATEASATHRIGDEIEARYKRGRKWYPGKVRAVNANGSYDIRYLDGDSERDVEAAFVRSIGGSAAAESPDSLTVGDKVEARFRGGSRWFKATVEGKNRDGTFSLSYDDGDFETAVERDHIRKVEGDRAGRKTAESSGRGAARRGVSRAGSETGTDVDQGEERKVHDRGETRSVERGADLPRAGDDVEARLRGSSTWRLGRVARAHRDGSYDVEYGRGKSERNVPASHVRSLAKKHSRSGDSDSDRKSRYGDTTKKSQTVAIAEGDQVEARLRGRSTWHSGEVTRVHSDGTYDVRYSRDGELEKRVEPRFVRLQHGPDSTVREGSPRTSNRRKSDGADTSSDEGSYRGTERGRRKEMSPIPQETASEDAEAAATKVRRSLRHAGKTVDDLVRKLERLRRSTGGIDENTLGRVLARVGIEISTSEARALRRWCPDVDNHGCVAPSALAGLVSGRTKSPIKRRRSSGSATRGGRRHASISELASDHSESESVTKGPASVARRGRVRGSSSSLDSGTSSGSSGGGRLHRRHHHAKAKAAPERRSPTQRKKLDTGSGSELDGDTSSDGQGMGGALVGNEGSRALRKLGGSAFDGSLRQEFDKLSGSGRRRVLPISSLKPLLRHLRVKLEESSLAEVMVVVDPDGLGSFSLQGLLEVALSTFEDKKISKVYSSVCEQLFKPTNGRGRKGRKESQEADAASAAVSKTLSKLEHPKGSGLLTTGDLKKLLRRVGARVSSEDAELLAERLDPADRGKVDREGLVVWLTSGFDVVQASASAESRASDQLCLLKAKKKGGKPENAFREFDVDRQGEHPSQNGPGLQWHHLNVQNKIFRNKVRKTDFVLALGRLGLVLTHGQATALAAKHHGDYEGFLATLADPPERLPEGAVSEGSDDSGSDTERGPKERKSWIKSIGRRRGGSNTNSRSRSRNSSRRKGRSGRGSGGEGGSSDESDRPLTSGSSEDGEEDEDKAEDEYDGLLLGMRARVALRDAFERACSATGGVKDIFCSAAGGGQSRSNSGRDVDTASGQGALLDREQTRRFLRRLKLDVPDDDRAALLDALAPPPGTSVGDGDDGRASGQKGVSFESDGGRKKRAKRDDGGGVGLVSYRDFLELVLAEQESKEVSKIHGRMSKDLARAADRNRGSKQSACPFALVVKVLSKQDAEGLGYIKVG
ncbi:unnamed protein product [Ectocarpus sp. 12 AP-2014]